MSILLSKAIMLATEVHMGQFCKGGEPYILHPLYVMSKFKDEKRRIIAVLHDVLEDGDNYPTLHEKIYNEFGKQIAFNVGLLSRPKHRSYSKYIKCLSANSVDARKVKIEDLKHNLDVRRLDKLKKPDLDRIKKYSKWLRYLEETQEYYGDVF